MRFSVTLLVLSPEPCDTIFAAASESDQSRPTAMPALRESVRFSSPRCLSAANGIFLRPISSHIPKARFRHTRSASDGCAAHCEQEDVAARGIAFQPLPHQAVKTVEPLAHVCCTQAHVDP